MCSTDTLYLVLKDIDIWKIHVHCKCKWNINFKNLTFQMQTKGPCLEEILCPQTSQCFNSVPEKVGLLSFLYMCSFFCFNFHYLSKAFLVSLHFLFHCFVITKLRCMLSHNHIVLFCITCFLLIACNPSSPSSFPFSHYLCML